MEPSYFIPIDSVTTEQVIKNSRFICSIARGQSRQEALSAVDTVRRQHPRASHVCWAYIAGAPHSPERGMSDDGEPHGTAGRPMLAMLEHSGLGEIWAAVTRYYGGVKLGTGGLVRAYSSSVQQTVKLIRTREIVPTSTMTLTIPYRFLSAVKKITEEADGTIAHERFQDTVELTLRIPSAAQSLLIRNVAAVSQGLIQLKKS